MAEFIHFSQLFLKMLGILVLNSKYFPTQFTKSGQPRIILAYHDGVWKSLFLFTKNIPFKFVSLNGKYLVFLSYLTDCKSERICKSWYSVFIMFETASQLFWNQTSKKSNFLRFHPVISISPPTAICITRRRVANCKQTFKNVQ